MNEFLIMVFSAVISDVFVELIKKLVKLIATLFSGKQKQKSKISVHRSGKKQKKVYNV